MSLSLDKSANAEYLRFLARFCGVSTASAAAGPIRVRLGKNNEIYQVATIAKNFARQANREAELCGDDAFEKAEISMWINLAVNLSTMNDQAALVHWKMVEDVLRERTYLTANRVTLGDAAVFWVLHDKIAMLAKKNNLVNLTRWFDQIQHTVGVLGFRDLDIVPLAPKQYALTT